jgi:hypothetical protein
MEPAVWQDVFKAIILLLIAALGSPFTQLVKNLLSKAFGKPVEDRPALVVTGGVAAIFAVLEMWLSGVLDFSVLTLQSFPTAFFAVFTVASVYYAWLKGSESILGRGGLLK